MRRAYCFLWLCAALSLCLFEAAEARAARGGMPGLIYLSAESIGFAQTMLEREGYLKAGAYKRGERDEATARAIRDYQRAHFLRPSGHLDTDTMAMLARHARPGDEPGRRPVATPPRSMPETGTLLPGAPAPGVRPAFGHLRIPRLGIETHVVEGTDPESLRSGPGHMKESARAGEPDNCIIAGHRTGPFGRFKEAIRGDVVEIAGPRGRARYRIVSREVVPRDDVRPLRPERHAVLTLITCHPFDHCGPAPDRLILRGELERPVDPVGPGGDRRPSRSPSHSSAGGGDPS